MIPAERIKCPDCPDGQVWTEKGPTDEICPTCRGEAFVWSPSSSNSESNNAAGTGAKGNAQAAALVPSTPARPVPAAPGEKQEGIERASFLGNPHLCTVRTEELDRLERELASAKRDADHFFQLSGRYLEELSAASAIERRDLEDALNIGFAALGYFNTEKMDKHWNEQERVLREIEKKMRRADNRNKDKP